jgi:hypothetical protein
MVRRSGETAKSRNVLAILRTANFLSTNLPKSFRIEKKRGFPPENHTEKTIIGCCITTIHSLCGPRIEQ